MATSNPRSVLGSIANVGSGPSLTIVPAAKPQTTLKKLRTSLAQSPKTSLSSFKNLPLDILFDIYHELDLETLFALSTTSKVCRTTLVGPSSKPIWARAREAAGLPRKIESDMTDIQFANLAVGKGCQVCLRKLVTRTDFYLRVRMCGPCRKANLVDASPANRDFRGGPAVLWPLKCAKNTVLSCVSFSIVPSPALGVNALHHYFLPHVFAMDTLMLRKDLHGDDWRSFHRQRRELVQRREVDAAALVAWQRIQEQDREDVKEEIRNTRRNDIEARLIVLGWNPCVFDSTWRLQKVLADPKPVTERTWPGILEKVEPFLKLHLALVLERQLKQRQFARRGALVPYYKAYSSTLSPWGQALLPPLYVVLALDAFRALWQPDAAFVSQPLWDSAVVSSLLPFESSLRRAFYDAIAVHHHHALSYDPHLPIPSLPTDPTNEDMERVFHLPTSTFVCAFADPCGHNGTCGSVSQFPEVLHHAIARHSIARRDDRDAFAGVHLLEFDPNKWLGVGAYDAKIQHEGWVMELGGHLLNKVNGVTDKNRGRKTVSKDVGSIESNLECMVSVGGPYGRDRCHLAGLDFEGIVHHLRSSHPNKTGAAGCYLISSVKVSARA